VPAAPVQTIPDHDTGTATISLRFDTQMLASVDAAAIGRPEPADAPSGAFNTQT
jgi:hypothetical protein